MPPSSFVARADSEAAHVTPRALARASVPAKSAARHIIEALMAEGVDTFFGIPGGPVSPLFEAVLNTRGARLIASRYEAAAAFGAMGYYRASGRVAAVLVTAGPGATNAMTGVAAAFAEAVPMVVVSGEVPWASTGARHVQDCGPEGLSLEAMFAPVTRAALRVAAALPEIRGVAAYAPVTDPLRLDDPGGQLPLALRRFYEGVGSPQVSAHRWHTPTLLVHANDDRVVPVEQTLTFRAALPPEVPVELVRVPAGDHYGPMIEVGIPRAISFFRGLCERAHTR